MSHIQKAITLLEELSSELYRIRREHFYNKELYEMLDGLSYLVMRIRLELEVGDRTRMVLEDRLPKLEEGLAKLEGLLYP